MTFLKKNSRLVSWLLVIAGVAIGFFPSHYNLSWKNAADDCVVTGVLLILVIIPGTFIVKRYPTRVGVMIYAILVGIAAGLLIWFSDKAILSWWFRNEIGYLEWFKSSAPARLIIFIISSCSVTTATAANKQYRDLEIQFNNLKDAATLHREAELFKLRQQLQPHFLYNSLNSISALILVQPEKAQEMIGRLSDFLRHSVKREGKEKIPVEEELDYIEAYLAIESVRFGDRLKVNYNKEYSDHSCIPPFLLQPILENAIKFGLYGRTGAVNIYVIIQLQSSNLTITITNPFDTNNKPPSGTGFGLEGIRRRLYLLYGRTDLLETKTENETFTTILKIPQSHV